MNDSGTMSHDNIPLCVDLDGTLIRSDLLFESVFIFLKSNLLGVFLLPFWLQKGREYLKRQIAQRVKLNVEALPYNSEVLGYLRDQHARGRKLILATASDEIYAKQIAEHLGIFSEVLASDGKRNLIGSNKAAELKERFGSAKFDYIGDSERDFKVWAEGRNALVVGSKAFADRVAEKNKVEQVFEEPGLSFVLLAKALRVHQWTKNLLLFVPAFMAHRLFEASILFSGLIAFFSFCFTASAVYLLNDLFDLEADRLHPKKSKRPLPAGTLALPIGLALVPVLLFASLLLALMLPSDFVFVLFFYFCITFAYSAVLKKIALVDIFVLASLYAIRIFAGGSAVAVSVSPWLLAFSMFFFLSLACVKRFAELDRLKSSVGDSAVGRGYSVKDISLISQLGATCGAVSVLVMALYIQSPAFGVYYASPELLWFLCLLIFFWIARVWLLAHRGQMEEDPILFAIRDRVSYLVGGIALILIFLAGN